MPETVTTVDALTLLADYLTNPKRVGSASVGLSIGGVAKESAERFFELRRAFGVEGYMTPEDALRSIKATCRD